MAGIYNLLFRGCGLNSFYEKRIFCVMALTAFVIVSCMLANNAEAVEDKCYSCHGSRTTSDNRPLDDLSRNIFTGGFQGNHRTHLSSDAQKTSCAKCHPGSDSYTNEHKKDGLISLADQIGNYPAKAGYGSYTSPFPQTRDNINPNLKTCSNVNCHFIKTTDSWGSQYFDKNSCNGCHGGPPDDGSHPRHFEVFSSAEGKVRGKICVRCHLFDHNTFAHATSAGKRGLLVVFPDAPNSGGSYSGDVSYPNRQLQ
jgi:predicted CxxxxCH...CXXCH cytochrome family protein